MVVLTEENKEIQEKIHVLEEEIEVLKKIKIEVLESIFIFFIYYSYY